MRPYRIPRLSLIPSLADLFFIVVFVLLFLSEKSILLEDCSTGFHIRAGEYILKTGSIPKFDIFSFHTPPLPWTAHEWLSEVVMAAIHSVFGLTGIVAFFAFLAALTTALLFKVLRAFKNEILIATMTTVLAVANCQLHWLARPHVFSLLMTVIFHYLLESWHRGRFNRLYLLPPVMLLWVNLHGGFLGGFILLGAYLAGNLFDTWSAPTGGKEAGRRKTRDLGLATAGCLTACLINPQGYHILLFPFQLVSNGYLMDHVSEFMSPNFHNPILIPFRFVLLLLIALMAVSKKRTETTELLLLIIFTNMALYSVRYIPLFALVTAPLLARKIDEARVMVSGKAAAFFRQRSENLSGIDAHSTAFLWSAGALCIVAIGAWSGSWRHQFDSGAKAVAACDFLMKERVEGNMFNNDGIGDYMIYRTYPSYRVFFDGRSDMYGSAKAKEYRKIATFQPGWESLLEKYRITWIIDKSDTEFCRFLTKRPEWKLIFSDKVTSIFVKDLPQYKGLIDRHRTVRLAIAGPE